jgi:hypothetical protein
MGQYSRPPFLPSEITHEQYRKWLDRKARAHLKRDQKRGNITATKTAYKTAIHEAVLASNGCDVYTGEMLDWTIISTYKNEISKAEKRHYKKLFALLPTVDHIDDGLGAANFCICSWRTNDAKNDLDLNGFLDLCKTVLEHHGYNVQPNAATLPNANG